MSIDTDPITLPWDMVETTICWPPAVTAWVGVAEDGRTIVRDWEDDGRPAVAVELPVIPDVRDAHRITARARRGSRRADAPSVDDVVAMMIYAGQGVGDDHDVIAGGSRAASLTASRCRGRSSSGAGRAAPILLILDEWQSLIREQRISKGMSEALKSAAETDNAHRGAILFWTGKLLAEARSAEIHALIATQEPSVDSLGGSALRAQLTTRLQMVPPATGLSRIQAGYTFPDTDDQDDALERLA